MAVFRLPSTVFTARNAGCCAASRPGAAVHGSGRVRCAAGSDAPKAIQSVGQHLGGRRQRFLGAGFDGFLGEWDAGEASYNWRAVLCSLHSRDEGDLNHEVRPISLLRV